MGLTARPPEWPWSPCSESSSVEMLRWWAFLGPLLCVSETGPGSPTLVPCLLFLPKHIRVFVCWSVCAPGPYALGERGLHFRFSQTVPDTRNMLSVC